MSKIDRILELLTEAENLATEMSNLGTEGSLKRAVINVAAFARLKARTIQAENLGPLLFPDTRRSTMKPS